MNGLTFARLAPRIDAGIIILCFEDGETETVKGTEIMGAVELYGDMYVRKVTPFANGIMDVQLSMEVQLSNTAEAGMV